MSQKKKAGVLSGLFWSFGERITAQLVTLGVSIVLARILDPDHYATAAIVTIFITIANAFVTGGFGNSLIQKKDADAVDFSTTLIFSLAFAVAFYFLLFFLAPFVADFYDDPILTPLVRVMSIRIIIASVNSVQHAYVSKQMAFKKFFFSTLFGTIVSGFVGVGMAVAGFGVWALAGQYLTNVTIDTIVLAFTCGWKPKLAFSFSRMKGLLSYGWKILVAEVLSTVYGELRGLILSKRFPRTELSYYNQGDKYPALFNHNTEASMNKVLFQKLSDVQDDLEKVKAVTRKSIRWTLFMLSPVYLGLAACGESLITLLLTEKWLGAAPYMTISCLIYLITPMISSHTRVMKALGNSGRFLMITVLRYTIGISLLLLTLAFLPNPYIVVFTGFVAMFIMWVICILSSVKSIGYTLKEQCADLLPPLFSGAVMYAVTRAVEWLGFGYLLTLALQIAVGVVSYFGLSFALNRMTVMELLHTAKRYLKKKK